MKQVIIVNMSLAMPTGKLAAQVAHASVATAFTSERENLEAWFGNGMPKIVLRGTKESVLVSAHEQAKEAKLPTQLIRDAGKTVLEAGTITCVAIGPAPAEEIDKITGELKLLR